ncbi:hypothetical protein GCM10027610_081310 [Dactylosporangium cerinum]
MPDMDHDVVDTPGVDVSRVAEVIATFAGGRILRGSGYQVTVSTVLTAWHLVGGAASVRLAFGAGLAGAWAGEGGSVLRIGDSDAALVTIDPWRDVAAAPLGGFGDRGVAVSGEVAGFPLWKLRAVDGREPVASDGTAKFREMAVEPAILCAGSNRRSGGMTLIVEAPGADDRSPWEGMSGGPVLCRGVLVGLVTHHHRREGLGRLAAVRLDLCLAGLPARQSAAILERFGVASLRDVGPSAESTFRSAYQEQVRDIAPADGLRGREAELDLMARFCVGDEPYMYWEGPPWAGKTALMASFALNPPAGVTVVSFFIAARQPDQADSSAFTDSLIEQLAAVVGEEPPRSLSASGRDALRRRLLRVAAERASAQGARLVLLIDGMDEDPGAHPGSGRPSIASRLPKSCPAGLRVLLAGRPHPDVPGDVDPDHPMRRIARTPLAVSPQAARIQHLALQELHRHLDVDDGALPREVIGLVTAAGGGLTVADLEALTGQPRDRVARLLDGILGRTLHGQPDPAGTDRLKGYAFAHETLSEQAGEALGPIQTGAYRQRLHRWADGFREAGWPDGTPRYLLAGGYPRMVEADGDADRLVALAIDEARHERLSDRTGSDDAAQSEVRSALRLVLQRATPDIYAALCLAWHRDRLNERGEAVPEGLPAVWAALGHSHRAEALALSRDTPEKRIRSLLAASEALADAGDRRRAIELASLAEQVGRAAGSVYRPRIHAVIVFALAHDFDRALAIARAMEDRRFMAVSTAAVAEEIAQCGDFGRAEALARTIEAAEGRAIALAVVASVARFRGDRQFTRRLADEAASIADGIQPVPPDVDMLTDLLFVADYLAEAGYPEAAHRIALRVHGSNVEESTVDTTFEVVLAKVFARTGDKRRAFDLYESSRYEYMRDFLAVAIAEGTCGSGDHDGANAFALGIEDPLRRLRVFAAMAKAAARDIPTRARQWAAAAGAIAEETQRVAPDDLVAAARALIAAGDHPGAHRLATQTERMIRERSTEPTKPYRGNNAGAMIDRRPNELRQLAAISGSRGDLHRAVGLTQAILNLIVKDAARARLAQTHATAHQYEEAEAVAGSLESERNKVGALAGIARIAAANGDQKRAQRLIGEAEAIARTSDKGISAVAVALASMGQCDKAESLVTGASRAERVEVAEAIARAGEHTRAARIARTLRPRA